MQTHNDKCWSWRGHEACARARVAELEAQKNNACLQRDALMLELAEAKREIARLEAEVESDNERWSRLTLRYVVGGRADE